MRGFIPPPSCLLKGVVVVVVQTPNFKPRSDEVHVWSLNLTRRPRAIPPRCGTRECLDIKFYIALQPRHRLCSGIDAALFPARAFQPPLKFRVDFYVPQVLLPSVPLTPRLGQPHLPLTRPQLPRARCSAPVRLPRCLPLLPTPQPLGELSFFLLTMQYSRAQMMNLGWKPYGHFIQQSRSRRLVAEYPNYNERLVKEWAANDALPGASS